MLYFLAWFIITVFHAADCIKFKYLIFLTHWGFVVWNSYLIVSAIAVAVSFYQRNQSTKYNINTVIGDYKIQGGKDTSLFDGRPDCCSISVSNGAEDPSLSALTVPYKIQWSLFLIGGEYAVAISILYWILFYDPDSEQNLYSLDSLNLHMINGIVAFMDLCLSGIPVRLYHVVYPIAFGFIYVLFTAVYYELGGRDPDGNQFIYPFLDYDSNPMAAVGLAVVCAVIFVGSIHLIFFLLYGVRQSILKVIRVKRVSMKTTH